MSQSAGASEIVLLPGFDGVAELRAEFVAALAEPHPARAIGYPARKLDSLNGYARHAAGQVGPQSRPVLICESFSGLVAARWASQDPPVAGRLLCGPLPPPPPPWGAAGAPPPPPAPL